MLLLANGSAISLLMFSLGGKSFGIVATYASEIAGCNFLYSSVVISVMILMNQATKTCKLMAYKDHSRPQNGFSSL